MHTTRFAFLSATALLVSIALQAQPVSTKTPSPGERYCSGTITPVAPPEDIWVVSGEEAATQVTFSEGDYVYINFGARQGALAGQRFLAVRPVADPDPTEWFRGQKRLVAGLGTEWEDIGQLRIVVAESEFSIAQIENSCAMMQRGDIVLPFTERPAPPLKPEEHFDRFAPATAGPVGILAATKGYHFMVAAGDIVYVNLGASQGIKPGDYLRICRYQDAKEPLVYQTPGMAEKVYGFGQSKRNYPAKSLPREVLGEAVVLRVSPTTATVLVTASLREIPLGSYVEVESLVGFAPTSRGAAASVAPAAQ
jgi:hypothetical protein